MVGLSRKRVFPKTKGDSITGQDRAQKHCDFRFSQIEKLEDLKVLRRSPDLLNNVKIGQGQQQLIMKQILFYHILGLQPFWSSDLNNPMNTPSNSPVISEEKMFR